MLVSNVTNFSMNSVKAKVELFQGSTLVKTCTCADVLQKFNITREGDQGKFFGYGISQKLSLILIDLDRELALTTSNSAVIGLGDGDVFDNPYPEFKFTEVDRDEKSNSITITAYDAIYKASAHLYNELGITAPYSIRTLAEACARLLGVPLNILVTDGSFDTVYDDGGNFDGSETVRAVLNSIAEVTQTIYFINNDNELVFKRLNKDGSANLTITKDDYYELTTQTNKVLTAICNATELGDNVSSSTGESGCTQYVRDNPLWELREDIATLLDDSISRVGGLTLNQFHCDWSGNYLLEIADKVNLATEDGGIVTSFILCDTVSYDGTFNETTSWSYTENDSESESNATSIGEAINQTFARVDKVNKEITLQVNTVREEQESIKSSVASLDIKSESISASVSSLQKATNNDIESVENRLDNLSKEVGLKLDTDGVEITVERMLEDGVEKVVTASKKYTFDDAGLSVSSADSNISTLITEDGMRIYRASQEVLTADNEGVKAEDLHATTYLIIGNTSRLEDRANRTACFWIGG